jgi:hypothetical protein
VAVFIGLGVIPRVTTSVFRVHTPDNLLHRLRLHNGPTFSTVGMMSPAEVWRILKGEEGFREHGDCQAGWIRASGRAGAPAKLGPRPAHAATSQMNRRTIMTSTTITTTAITSRSTPHLLPAFRRP